MALSSYWLDADDAIVRVSGDWDRFARENDGSGLYSADIRGKSIWSFISGDSSRMWLEALLQLTRLTGKPISRPYRCDSPDLKRFMTMTIIPEGSGRLRIEHTIISTVPRQAPIYFHYAPKAAPSRFYQRCSVCGRVRRSQAEPWLEADELCEQDKAELSVIYSVCGDCGP